MQECFQVRSSTALVTATMFVDVSYSPAVLLESRLDASITDDLEFRSACQWGFHAYFEDMYEPNELGDDFVFVERWYSWAEVRGYVMRNMSCKEEMPGLVVSYASRVGVVLGWLSALALVQRELAIQGVTVLAALVRSSWSLQRGMVA